MRLGIAVAALAAVPMLPLAASGQDAVVAADPRAGTDDTRLELEMKRKRVIVHPTPSPAVVERDVDRADVVTEERRERIIRELTRPVPRRPDLGYDVTSGIQGRNLQQLRR